MRELAEPMRNVKEAWSLKSRMRAFGAQKKSKRSSGLPIYNERVLGSQKKSQKSLELPIKDEKVFKSHKKNLA
jgi:hypothetical protein